MSAWVWIAIVLVGGLGASGRFLLDSLVTERAGRTFPYGTLTVNLSGAFALGLLAGLAVEGDAYLIVGTAGLGSFTTFSTWMFETQRLVEDAEISRAIVNALLSLAAGFAAVVVGHVIGANA
jgi:fluoride exporter